MTARAVTVLAVVAALAGCGGGGGGGGGGSTASGAPGISLDLKGGTNETTTACGSQHHFAVFRRGETIRFSGTVKAPPQARWKVKLKLKVCRGGSFQDLAKVDATRDKKTGFYSGTFLAGAPGQYYARATVYENGAPGIRSDKRHYTVH
jgi:hypothetical protein